MSLDDKLREILNNAHKANFAMEPLIAQIKQAFAEEKQPVPVTRAFLDKAQEIGLMTGQAWFQRFEKEYHKLLDVDDQVSIKSSAVEAARRASGIKEEPSE